MSVDEFRKYPKWQQWQIAGHQGKLILSKRTPNHQIKVFQMDNFFVEAWQNLNNQMLDSLVTYQSGKLLEKYADEINIDDLYR